MTEFSDVMYKTAVRSVSICERETPGFREIKIFLEVDEKVYHEQQDFVRARVAEPSSQVQRAQQDLRRRQNI